MIKSKRMRLRNAYRTLIEKPEWKRKLEDLGASSGRTILNGS
jgi:hypothetical protein